MVIMLAYFGAQLNSYYMKHDESKMQQRCVEWFRYSFPRTLIASFPNGVYIGGTPVQRARRWNLLKAEGAMPGMPDLMICSCIKSLSVCVIVFLFLVLLHSNIQQNVSLDMFHLDYLLHLLSHLLLLMHIF